jgi:hypothetical protein
MIEDYMRKLKKYYEHVAVTKSLDDFIKEELNKVDDLKTIDVQSTLIRYNEYAIAEIRAYKLKQLNI